MGSLLLLASVICWIILWHQFPSGLCHCRFKLGCRCGKKRRKAETRATDIERQERERAGVEQSRIEGLFNLLATLFGQEAGFPAAQARARALPEDLFRQIGPSAVSFSDLIRRRAGLTGEELFRDIGPTAVSFSDLIRRRAGLTGEDLFRDIGPTAVSLSDIIRQRVAAPPTIPFEDTLSQNLRLAYDAIANRFAQRGIPSFSGLSQEGFGRAGVELAIREAQAREQNRLLNEQLRQQTLAEGLSLAQFASGLAGESRGEQGLLAQFASGLSEESRGEQGLLAQFASELSKEARGEQSALASLMAQLRSTGALTGTETFQRGQQRAFEASQTGLGLLREREQAAAARDAGIGKAIGTLLAAPLAAIPGVGPLLFTTAAPAFGQIGGTIGGGGSSQGGGASDALAAMRIANLQAPQQPFRGAGASQYFTPEELQQIYQPQRSNILSRIFAGMR